MDYKEGNADELKKTFWKAFSSSPFCFLERKAAPEGAVVMTAQLDKDANSAMWFFTRRTHHLAQMGPAIATYAGKDNQIFARIEGALTEETSRERLEEHWNQIIEAWFPKGKEDPDLLMLRMDLDKAEIWNSDLGMINNAKMLLGMDVREEAAKKHTEANL